MNPEPMVKEINGVTYEITQFLGEDCFKHYVALTKLTGEPIARALIAAVSAKDKKESPVAYLNDAVGDLDVTEAIPAISEAIIALADKLSPQETLTFFKAILKNVRIITAENSRQMLNFNLHFGGGRMKPLFILFALVLEVNFADFLPDGFSLITAVKDVVEAVKE